MFAFFPLRSPVLEVHFLVCNVGLQERKIIVVTFVIKDDGKTYSDAE